MKTALLIPVFACCFLALRAQQSNDSTVVFDLHANNIKAHIYCTGQLSPNFYTGQGALTPHPDSLGNGPSTIYGAGLWIAGYDSAGQLRLDAHTFRSTDLGSPSRFCSGPLDSTGNAYYADSLNWIRVFRARGGQISAFLSNLTSLAANPALAESLFPDILGWPGRGNPYFFDVRGFNLPDQSLAPFNDMDHDGIYNPLKGDYPAVKLASKPPFVPALITWCVFNDLICRQPNAAVFSFPLEVQLTAWAFNCPDQAVLDNTVFTSYKLIYKGDTPLHSSYIGASADMDIGCADDDYIGCSPALNAFYAYNADAIDNTTGSGCDGILTFGDHAPVQSITLLDKTMDKFIWYTRGGTGLPNGMTDPTPAAEFYNYLSGHWKDGSNMTQGGSGYNGTGAPVSYIYPGDPGNPSAWSMCSANLPPADVRGLGSHYIGMLLPGQTEEFTTALTVHENINLPCGIGNTLGEIAGVRAQFDQNFAGVCMPVTKVSDQRPATLELFPNPATQQFTLRYGTLHVREVRLTAVDGCRVSTIRELPEGGQAMIDVSGLPAGVYGVEIVTDQGNFAQKLCVVR
jgi:hypothetical protein